MHLMDRCQSFGWKAEPAGHPRPVFPDPVDIVIRADADVQARINAFGDAAVAREEAMAYPPCSMPFQGFALDRNRLMLHRPYASLRLEGFERRPIDRKSVVSGKSVLV